MGALVDKSLESDKHYWHGYTKMYESIFSHLKFPEYILEFGVFHGASIRFLAERFPSSKITGLDILPFQSDWPTSEAISYGEVDQSNRHLIEHFLKELNQEFDLVIEDGSHHPQHQINSLLASVPFMKKNSIYVIEDIHTSKFELSTFGQFDQKLKRGKALKPKPYVNLYNFLLGFDHALKSDVKIDYFLKNIDWNVSRLTRTEAKIIADSVLSVHFFNRNTYPAKCFNCGGKEYVLGINQCICGVNILSSFDSICAYLIFK
jgi:cephalosporin hydroxylase